MRDNQNSRLCITGLRKTFSGHVALQDISLTLETGKVLALIGPSGCGKTTLLRCIAGLIQPDAGEIRISGQTVFSSNTARPPETRDLGMVFQDYALWPHMTVAQNVSFPLEMAGMARGERIGKVQSALSMVGLEHLSDQAPGTLSGGQQQRVALARAIVNSPGLLLMDEPLSNLDKNLRESLALDIRQLIGRLGLTAVMVTHDQQEAYALADSVAVLQEGVLAQVEAPEQLYRSPATPDIARFLDAGTLVQGVLKDSGFYLGSQWVPSLPTTDYRGALTVLVQRQSVCVCEREQADLVARVEGCLFQGEFYTLRLRLDQEVSLRMQSTQRVPLGDTVGLRLARAELLAWDDQNNPCYPFAEPGATHALGLASVSRTDDATTD